MQGQQRVLRLGSGLGVVPIRLGLCGGHRLVSLGHQGCDDGHLGMVVLGAREILEHRVGCRWGVLWPSGHAPRQLGAQLSFAATAALMALQGEHLAWRVPLRAQWATLPWNVHDFQTFPFLFYPANVLAAVAVWGPHLWNGSSWTRIWWEGR